MGYVQLAMAFLGQEQSSKMTQKQLDLLGQQLANMAGIKLPDLEKITPEQLGPSAAAGVAADPALKAQQLAALGDIQRIADQGGLTIEDKASLEDAMGAANNQQHRAQETVAADAAARGQYGGNQQLMMSLEAAQAGANGARSAGTTNAANAASRRIQAVHDAANMAGGMRTQDVNEREAAARAKDLRDERNATAAEKAQYYNAGLPQQQFTNQMSKATGQLAPANNLSAAYANAGNEARANAAGMSNAVGALGGGGGSQPASTQGYAPEASNLTSLSSNPYPEGNPSGGGSNPDEWNQYPTS